MIKRFLYILCFLAFATSGWSAVCTAGSGTDTCTVTQDGSGADYSAAGFNALSGDYSNDTFYFSGNFTTRITVNIYGTSGNPLILDGYAAGDYDALGETCTPNNTKILDGAACSPATNTAVLTQGMLIGDTSTGTGPDYVQAQDFRMTRTGTLSCFTVAAPSGQTTNYFYGQRNLVYETNGTMFYTLRANYGTLYRNQFVIFGQNGTDATQGVNFIDGIEWVVRQNVFGHNETDYPDGCSSANTVEIHEINKLLFENNIVYGAPNQAGIATKENANNGNTPNEYHIYRYNIIRNNKQNGLYVGGGYDYNNYMYIYANLFLSNGNESAGGAMSGATSYDGGSFHYWWSNLFINNSYYGLLIADIRTPSQGVLDNIYAYNNSFSYNGDRGSDPNALGRGGIVVGGTTNDGIFVAKNNVLYYNRPLGAGGTNYSQIFDNTHTSNVFDYNTLYHPLGTATWYYQSGARTLATMQGTYSQEAQGEIADPGFTDPDGADTTYGTTDDDLTLVSSGTVGQDLSLCFSVTVQGIVYAPCIDDALDPNNTDWTTTPPTVAVLDRDLYQWDRGAYVYADAPASSLSPQIIVIGN